MSNHNKLHPAGDTSQEAGRFGLFKKAAAASIAGTALFSTLGTIQANSPEDRGPQRVLVHSANPNVPGTSTSSTIGTHDVLSGGPSLPGIRVDAVTISSYEQQEDGTWLEVTKSHVETIQDIDKIQKMIWARLFDEDPAARETADAAGEVDAAVDAVQELLAQGWTIDAIKFHGFASDEDDTTWQTGQPGAGLGVDSEKNVSLAEERADAVYDLFAEKLAAEGVMDTLPMEITGGTESRDEALNDAIAALAERRGESVQDVIVAWNRGQHDSFTDAELDVLNQLKDHRYVSITVEAHRTVTETTMVYKEGEWVEVTSKKDEGSLVLIPGIIPVIPGRRKSKSGSSEPDPSPDVLPVPQPSPDVPPAPQPSPDVPSAPDPVVPWVPSKRRIPPRTIGDELPGHNTQWSVLHKQPGKLNNGGNRGSRGQREPNTGRGNVRRKASR